MPTQKKVRHPFPDVTEGDKRAIKAWLENMLTIFIENHDQLLGLPDEMLREQWQTMRYWEHGAKAIDWGLKMLQQKKTGPRKKRVSKKSQA